MTVREKTTDGEEYVFGRPDEVMPAESRDGNRLRRRFPLRPLMAVLALLALVIGPGIYLLFFAQRKAPVPPGQPLELVDEKKPPLPEKAAAARDVGPLPAASGEIDVPLDDSDPVLRQTAAGFSTLRQFRLWLHQEEQVIRRFVAVVDNIANGQSPRAQLLFLQPGDQFKVVYQGDAVWIDPASYRRYRPAVDVLLSLDSGGCALLYRRAHALIEQAYRELGYPRGGFDKVLQRAFAEVLKTPRVRRRIDLTPRLLSFGFSDGRLENLSDAQKHFIRLGPDNLQRVQEKLLELAMALGMEPSSLPAAPVWR